MTHEEKVLRIAEEVRQRAAGGEPVELAKKSVSHFVPLPGDPRYRRPAIDLSPLSEILRIDTQARTCTAEPGVTFSDLVRATLPHGLAPYTVPELKTITIGGAVSGCSIEAMSYRHGGFHDSCLEYEVVTGTGEVVTVSPEKDDDLFQMVHGSYGTLAIITKITFRLVPAKPYVRMQYVTFQDFDTFWSYLRERCEVGDHELVDAILHAPDKLVVCLGDFVDKAPYSHTYDWMSIYWRSTGTLREDYLPTYEYFFRYDAEAHWLTRTVPILETAPARLLVGKWFLGSTNLIRWSHRLAPILKRVKRRPDVVVDVFVPAPNFETFFHWYVKDFQFWPLWIVPYRMPRPYPWIADEHHAKTKGDLWIDAAVYGKPNSDPATDWSAVLEKKVFELGGIKTLISRNHYDEETFWATYSRPHYEAAKARLDPKNVFGHVYDKFAQRGNK